MLPGLNKDFIASCIHPNDLQNADIIENPCDADGLARRAELVLKYGFAGLKLDEITIKGHVAHCVRSTQHSVVLRGLNRILRRATGIKPLDRDLVIRRLHTVLQEGVPHRVYKFDIKSFFDSLNRNELLKALAVIPQVPRSALLTLHNYFNHLTDQNIVGLPRGIPLSATLAEISLQEFDKKISGLPEVYFHARYVDDIIIVTGARESQRDFVKDVVALLPPGLSINHQKTKAVDLPVSVKGQPDPPPGQFDYLGYSFEIHPATRRGDRRFIRQVDVTLAKRKVQRMKTRLCLAVCQYLQDDDLWGLERRLQLLTGNCTIRDFVTGRERSIGLYCNYRRINSVIALEELDRFLRSVLIGRRLGIAKRFAMVAPVARRRELLRYSFLTSYKQKKFYSFSPYQLAELRRCWQNAQ